MSVKIVDAPMGFGKTSAMINFIAAAPPDERFIFVTPYLDELIRVRDGCPDKHFRIPSSHNENNPDKKPVSKMLDLGFFLGEGFNIATTHSLFQKFNDETLQLIKDKGYILIMDEVMDVFGKFQLTPSDVRIIRKDLTTEDSLGRLNWKVEGAEVYDGKFNDEKRMCDLGMLWGYNNTSIIQVLPPKMFKAFKDVYILTYMFRAQKQRYYFDIFKIPYQYKWVTGDSPDTYRLTNTPVAYMIPELKDLIHVCQDRKLNSVGTNRYALSKKWYESPKKSKERDELTRNAYNYLQNKMGAKADQSLWTCFKDKSSGKPIVKVKSYSSGYLSCNARATNAYRNRNVLVYAVNRFFSPTDAHFLEDQGIEVDQDTWALSEMIQWIWRSAIRDGKEIWVYVPSKRMRTLLETWIEEISNGLEGSGEEAALVSPEQTPATKTAGEEIPA